MLKYLFVITALILVGCSKNECQGCRSYPPDKKCDMCGNNFLEEDLIHTHMNHVCQYLCSGCFVKDGGAKSWLSRWRRSGVPDRVIAISLETMRDNQTKYALTLSRLLKEGECTAENPDPPITIVKEDVLAVADAFFRDYQVDDISCEVVYTPFGRALKVQASIRKLPYGRE